jgi:mannitol/fructose-specific phosphotransferase system IIA component (Ntr-type)
MTDASSSTPHPAPREERPAQLSEALDEKAVVLNLQAGSKFEAIDLLVDAMVEAGRLQPQMRSHIVGVVRHREQSMSTGTERGIALPHGSTEQVEHMVGALGVSPEGVPFDTLDGEPAHIIVLLVLPKQHFAQHVRALAAIAHSLRQERFREGLLRAHSPAAAMQVVASFEQDAPAGETQ